MKTLKIYKILEILKLLPMGEVKTVSGTIPGRAKEVAGRIWYEKRGTCLVCGEASSEAVCSDCREKYFLPGLKRCVSCGKLLDSRDEQCQDCRTGKGPKNLRRVISLGWYEGAWKDFIYNIKYKGQPYLLFALAEYLVGLAIRELPPPDAVIPVPLHPNRLAQRGFNQAEVLASILGRILGIRIKDVLIRVEDTKPQTLLGRQERRNNLQGAFGLKINSEVAGEVIWLVDDIITTGITMEECARILRENGAEDVFAFCLGAGRENSSH